MTTDLVRFRAAFSSPRWSQLQDSVSTLRFLDAPALDVLVVDAGLTVEERYGYWDGSPFTAAVPEIITIARRSTAS